jgi:SNF2 family DNA or RNA helicase
MVTVRITPRGAEVVPASPREAMEIAATLTALDPTAVFMRSGAARCRLSALAGLAGSFPPESHFWDAESTKLVRGAMRRAAFEQEVRSKVSAALDDAAGAVAGYSQLHRLDAHQVDVLAALSVEGLEGLGLFDEQGTGKTISCLCGFDFLRSRGRVDQLLVVAPKSMVETWAEAARSWVPGARPVVVAGSIQASVSIAKAENLLIVTYETAVRVLALLQAWAARADRRTLLVVDESFFVKNPRAERSRAIAELRSQCTMAIVACGTPAPNAPADIVNQMDIADRGHTFQGTLPESIDNIEAALRDRAVYLRRLKSDVLPGLPSKTFVEVAVPMAPRQAAMYRSLRDELVLQVRAIDDRVFEQQYASFLARRTALLQICSHPGALDPSYDETPAKFRAIDALLERLFASNEKVIIWSFYTYSLDALATRYSRHGLVRVDGTITDTAQRARAVRSFQTDKTVRLFLGNPAAAGAGLTLTAARHAVYESLSNQAAHYLQSLDRIHRRGQEREVEYHVLLTEGSLERAEYGRLLQKEQRASQLLGDPPAPRLTREAFLADLGG